MENIFRAKFCSHQDPRFSKEILVYVLILSRPNKYMDKFRRMQNSQMTHILTMRQNQRMNGNYYPRTKVSEKSFLKWCMRYEKKEGYSRVHDQKIKNWLLHNLFRIVTWKVIDKVQPVVLVRYVGNKDDQLENNVQYMLVEGMGYGNKKSNPVRLTSMYGEQIKVDSGWLTPIFRYEESD